MTVKSVPIISQISFSLGLMIINPAIWLLTLVKQFLVYRYNRLDTGSLTRRKAHKKAASMKTWAGISNARNPLQLIEQFRNFFLSLLLCEEPIQVEEQTKEVLCLVDRAITFPVLA